MLIEKAQLEDLHVGIHYFNFSGKGQFVLAVSVGELVQIAYCTTECTAYCKKHFLNVKPTLPVHKKLHTALTFVTDAALRQGYEVFKKLLVGDNQRS